MTKVYQFFLKTKLASDKEMVFKNSSTQIVTLLLGLHLSALLTTLQCTDKIPFLLQLYLRMITDIIKPFIFCFPSISFDCIVMFIFFFCPLLLQQTLQIYDQSIFIFFFNFRLSSIVFAYKNLTQRIYLFLYIFRLIIFILVKLVFLVFCREENLKRIIENRKL